MENTARCRPVLAAVLEELLHCWTFSGLAATRSAAVERADSLVACECEPQVLSRFWSFSKRRLHRVERLERRRRLAPR